MCSRFTSVVPWPSLTDIDGEKQGGLPWNRRWGGGHTLIHMPVYYRTFPDMRDSEPWFSPSQHAGLPMSSWSPTGAMRRSEPGTYILKTRMIAHRWQSQVMEKILSYGDFSTRPDGMAIDQNAKIYYQQFAIDYPVESAGTSVRQSEKLRLNLYFDSVRRSEELVQLDIDITEQHKKLQLLLLEQEPLEDDQSLKRHFRYFKLQYDSGERLLKSFTLNDKKVEKARRTSGFFSIMTHKLDMDAMQTYQTYKLRDEQEKAFQQMKTQMVADRQRNWSEEGKTGRLSSCSYR